MTLPSPRLAAKAIAFWPTVLIVAGGDFITKRIAEAELTLHVPHQVVGDWVRFTLLYNTGAALNISLGDYSRIGLSAVAVTMLAVLYQMYRQSADHDAWQALALGLIAAGALGNLLDRIRSAKGVVDFIDVGTADWRFYTFNVADAAVTCGAILLAALLVWGPSAGRSKDQSTDRPPRPPERPSAPPSADPANSRYLS